MADFIAVVPWTVLPGSDSTPYTIKALRKQQWARAWVVGQSASVFTYESSTGFGTCQSWLAEIDHDLSYTVCDGCREAELLHRTRKKLGSERATQPAMPNRAPWRHFWPGRRSSILLSDFTPCLQQWIGVSAGSRED